MVACGALPWLFLGSSSKLTFIFETFQVHMSIPKRVTLRTDKPKLRYQGKIFRIFGIRPFRDAKHPLPVSLPIIATNTCNKSLIRYPHLEPGSLRSLPWLIFNVALTPHWATQDHPVRPL
ncbi:hypothetical protein BDR22DRAFT_844626 [Usnea florida]